MKSIKFLKDIITVYSQKMEMMLILSKNQNQMIIVISQKDQSHKNKSKMSMTNGRNGPIESLLVNSILLVVQNLKTDQEIRIPAFTTQLFTSQKNM